MRPNTAMDLTTRRAARAPCAPRVIANVRPPLLQMLKIKHWWAPVGTAALYMIGPLIGVAVFQQHRG